jgi:hypothetical protein
MMKNSVLDKKSQFEKFKEMAKEGKIDEVKKLIEDKVSYLEENSDQHKELNILTGKVSEFISSKTNLVPNLLFGGAFRINDKNIYSALGEALKISVNMKSNIGAEDGVIAATAVFITVFNYFGMNVDGKKTMKRDALYTGHSLNDNITPVSMEEFKGKAIAECLELSTVAQDLFTAIGIDSTTIFSGNCRIEGSDDKFNHVFNMIESKGKHYLFDPANPSIMAKTDLDGKVTNFTPKGIPVYLISEEEYESIMNGGSIKRSHYEYSPNNEVLKEYTMVYSL